MSGVTQILQRIESGDPSAAEQLLPLVYDELRKLAARNMARESPDHTLQPTALVHEAYLRLVAGVGAGAEPQAAQWNSRGHFFAAAAEAMRRILVESARRKQRLKHGGDLRRVELSNLDDQPDRGDDLVLCVDESLESLARENVEAAQLVKLRFFGGLTLPEAAAALNISPRSADRLWAYAKAWLHQQLEG
jgi:RNA polymerase sigma factor (TIGR02999 family)